MTVFYARRSRYDGVRCVDSVRGETGMTAFGASRSRYDDVRCVDSVRRGVNST